MQPGLLEAPPQGARAALGDLAVDQQGEAVLERHVVEIAPRHLFEEGGVHAGQAQPGDALGQGVGDGRVGHLKYSAPLMLAWSGQGASGAALDIGEIGAGAQDRVEPAIGGAAELERVSARGVEAFPVVAPGETENAEARPEAELGLAVAGHDRRDEALHMRAALVGFALDPGAGSLDTGALVLERLVFPDRGGAALETAARMAGDPLALVKDLDQIAAQADVDPLVDIFVAAPSRSASRWRCDNPCAPCSGATPCATSGWPARASCAAGRSPRTGFAGTLRSRRCRAGR